MFDQEADEGNNDFVKRIIKAYSYVTGGPYPFNDNTKTVTLQEARDMANYYNEMGYERDIIEELFGSDSTELTAEWVIDPLQKLTEILDNECLDGIVIYSTGILEKVEQFGNVAVDNKIYAMVLANDGFTYLSDNRRRQIMEHLTADLYRISTHQMVESIDINGDVIREIIQRTFNFGTVENPTNVISRRNLTLSELSRIAYKTFKWEQSHIIPRLGYLVFEPVELPEGNQLMGPQFKAINGNCVINELKKHVDVKLHKKLDSYNIANGIDIETDLKALSKMLKINIKYKDVDGNTNAEHFTKCTHKKTVQLYGSNNHCFGTEPPTFPTKRTIEYYPNHIMLKMINKENEAINGAIRRLKTNKITPSQYSATLMPEIEKIQCEFIKEIGGELVFWIFGFNLIASNGVVYIYQDNYTDSYGCDHEGECVFELTSNIERGEWVEKYECKHAKPTLLINKLYKDLYGTKPTEDLRTKYFSETAMIFKYFIKTNGIMPLIKFNDEFKRANFEVLAVPYFNNLEGPKSHIDIVTSYLAVQESTPHTSAIEYIKKYGYISGNLLMQVTSNIEELFNSNINGIAHLNKYKIHESTPKPIKFLLATHLSASDYIAIPLLDYAKKFMEFECDHAIVGLEKLENFKLPNTSKHYNRVLIGKLAENREHKIVCSDPFEAKTRLENHTAFDYYKCNEMIILKQKCETKKYHHIRQSILAYAAINLFMNIEKFDDSKIAKVLTDGIIYVGDQPTSLNMGQNPGQFRNKPTLNYQATNSIMPKLSGEYPKCEINRELPDIRFSKKIVYCEGLGGSGKSFQAVKNATIIYGEENVILAVPSHELKNNFLKTHKIACNTWQAVVGLSYDASKWTPESAKYSAHRRQCVIIDEIFTMGSVEDIKKYTNALLEAGSNVILLGDPHQLNYVGGGVNSSEETANYLRTLPFIEFNDDFRAVCPKLQQLKREIRGKPDNEQIAKIRSTIRNEDINEMLAQWSPDDLILCTTHEMRNYINGRLLELHKKKFSTHPIQLVVKKTEKRIYTFKGHSIKLYANNILTLSMDEFEEFKDFDKFILGYTRTIHSIQGITTDKNLYLIYDRLDASFSKNSAYVAISRCKYLDQIHFIYIGVNADLLDNIRRRINYLKNQMLPSFTLLEFIKLYDDGKFIDCDTKKPITNNFAIQQIDASKNSYDISNIKFKDRT